MTIAEYITALQQEQLPNFFILCSTDAELRLVYLKLFCDAHKCKHRHVESIDFKNRTRVLGKKEVLVLTDFKPVLDKPSELYTEYNKPVVYMYTNPKGINESVEKFYNNNVLIVNEITRTQAEYILAKKGVDKPIIDYLIRNVENPTHVRRHGLRLLEMCKDLNINQKECFKTYFEAQLRADIGENPEPLFQAILTCNMTFIHTYLRQQEGNEFYIYASLFNWLGNLIRFRASYRSHEYWSVGGLAKAVSDSFPHTDNWLNIPISELMCLYCQGIDFRTAIKSTERDARVALEVFICCIIRTLKKGRIN